MQLISCHDGKILKVGAATLDPASADRAFVTGLDAVDGLLPPGGLARGAVHEVLAPAGGATPYFFGAVIARAAVGARGVGGNHHGSGSLKRPRRGGVGAPPRPRVVWCDPRGEIYPPALGAVGISLDQIFLLRPTSAEDEIWALGECMGCRGVAVTVARPPELTRVQARRLQLAAERGGGVGVLVRPHGAAGSRHHAAATRWLVEPARGERTVQRWKIQLIHGHGGLLNRTVYLEYSRETHRVRATAELADRQAPTKGATTAIG